MFQVDKAKCTGCSACINECPVEAISIADGKAEIDDSRCIDCGRCIQVCSEEAIYSEVQRSQNIPQQQGQRFFNTGFGIGGGMGKGLGRGKGRGLARGPRDGRGRGGR